MKPFYFLIIHYFFFFRLSKCVCTNYFSETREKRIIINFFFLKMSESVILVRTVQTKPYIFLYTSDGETDHAVRIISRNLVEPNEMRRIPRLSFCMYFETERTKHGVPCGTCMGDTWHMGGPSVMPLGLHDLGGSQMSSHPHA